MQESIVNESPRRGIALRVLAAMLALATVLVVGGCRSFGGGYIDEPLQGDAIPPDVPPFELSDGVYQADANFGFNFTCEMKGGKAVIRGQITYHDRGTSTIDVPVDPELPAGPTVETDFPEIRIHGTVDPIVMNVPTCEAAVLAFPNSTVFEGNYRSQDTTVPGGGRFNVLVFDQGEPGRTKDPEITGDGFAIELHGLPYGGYTRGGYIEGGNIQVDNT